ncbi:hypothetical protein [Nocardia brasiliensis]|uniref:hypothetical protein n=1 Tax=Nocardia brasiliensis TaxID=37326 RepID=UPI003D90C7E1
MSGQRGHPDRLAESGSGHVFLYPRVDHFGAEFLAVQHLSGDGFGAQRAERVLVQFVELVDLVVGHLGVDGDVHVVVHRWNPHGVV